MGQINRDVYMELIRRGYTSEQADSVLPIIEKCFVKGDLNG